MKPNELHSLSNRFQDVRLISLRTWKGAAALAGEPSGPYFVAQEGYDPEDPRLTPDEFLLGQSGQWLSTRYFIHLPKAQRQAEYLFRSAADVIARLETLPSKPVIVRPGQAPTPAVDSGAEPDDLLQAFQEARKSPDSNPPAAGAPSKAE